MGRAIALSASLLDEAGTEPGSFIVPELPWQVRVNPDQAVLVALADASREIGRLEGADRTAGQVIQGRYALASIKAWCCVLATDAKVSWGEVGRAFVGPKKWWEQPWTDAELAAGLIEYHLGLRPYGSHQRVTEGVPNELDTGEVVSPHFRAEFEFGIAEWLADGSGSGLIKAAMAMMSMAASMPHSRHVAMAARAAFPRMLTHARGSDVFVPISFGFLGFSSEWDSVARALASPDGYDDSTLNRALELVLRAVERAAFASSFQIEGHQYVRRQKIPPALRVWFAESRPLVRNILYTLHALPSASRPQLEELTGYPTRSVNRAVRSLAERDLVRIDGTVRGDAVYVVRAKPRWTPWPKIARLYPSVSAAWEGQR